jgi:hypothetical protein
MNKILSMYIDKLFFKKWIIGVCQGNIEDIIRRKTFDLKINWLLRKPYNTFYGDPFPIVSHDGNIKILLEEYPYDEDYGKISLMTFDKKFRKINHKVLLDNKSHLSYPFVFSENNKTYVFPESKKIGKLACYEYDSINESMHFKKNILDLPLLDSTILKHDDKYWIFGTLSENDSNYKLYIFFSDSLLGPYTPHPSNPVKMGLDGTRSAGNFIKIDGIIYRPTQNCEQEYGRSITINSVTELNETRVTEEPYMTICIDEDNLFNHGMHKIHTINVIDNLIVVDGMHWNFAPFYQLKKFVKSIFKIH